MLPGGRILSGPPKGKAYLYLGLLAGGPVILLVAALLSPPVRGTLKRTIFGREAREARTFPTRAEDAPVPRSLLQPPAEAPRPSPESLLSGPPSVLPPALTEEGMTPSPESRSRRRRSSSEGGDAADAARSTEEGPIGADTAEERVKTQAERIAEEMASKVTGAGTAGSGSRRGLSPGSLGARGSAFSRGRPGGGIAAPGSTGSAENAAGGFSADGPARAPSFPSGGAAEPQARGPRLALSSISRVSRNSSSGGGATASGSGFGAGAPAGEAAEGKSAPGAPPNAFGGQKAVMKSAEGLMADAKEANARAGRCRGVVDENTPAIHRLTKEQGDLSTQYANQCRSGLVNCLGHYPYGFNCRSMDPDECDKWSTCRRPKAGSEWEMEDYPCCVRYHWDFLGCWHNWGGQRRIDSGCWNRQKGYVCPCSTLRCGIEQKCRGINARNCDISKGCGDACKPVSCASE